MLTRSYRVIYSYRAKDHLLFHKIGRRCDCGSGMVLIIFKCIDDQKERLLNQQ